jgi:putative ABC transport system permease protein
MRLATEIVEGARISLAALLANKMRSALTTVGIVIGIVTVTLMSSAIEGINRAFKESVSILGSDVLYVARFDWFIDSYEDWMKVANRREITWQQYEAVLKQMTLAKAVAPIAGSGRPIRYKNRKSDRVTIIGTSDQFMPIAGLNMLEGRFMTASEADGGRPLVVLGYQVATNLFASESPIGRRIKIGEESVEVIGVLQAQGTFLGEFSWDNRVIVPIRYLVQKFRQFPDYEIHVKALSLEKVPEAIEELRGILRRARQVRPGDPDDFAINQQEQFLTMFNRVSRVIAAGGLFITGLSLLVGGIGIMNIMFVSVAERTREIGIRKAIGAKRRAILLQFLIEAAGICLFGGLLGLAIAAPCTLLLKKVLPATFSMQIAVLALSVSAATGIISGFLPAWRAARMNPVDALRNE